jgi:hypothetical protein
MRDDLRDAMAVAPWCRCKRAHSFFAPVVGAGFQKSRLAPRCVAPIEMCSALGSVMGTHCVLADDQGVSYRSEFGRDLKKPFLRGAIALRR